MTSTPTPPQIGAPATAQTTPAAPGAAAPGQAGPQQGQQMGQQTGTTPRAPGTSFTDWASI